VRKSEDSYSVSMEGQTTAARWCLHLTSVPGLAMDHWVQQIWCPHWDQHKSTPQNQMMNPQNI